MTLFSLVINTILLQIAIAKAKEINTKLHYVKDPISLLCFSVSEMFNKPLCNISGVIKGKS